MVPQEFLAQGERGEHDQAACHVLLTTLQLHMSSLKLSIKHWGNLLRGGGGWGGPAVGGLGVVDSQIPHAIPQDAIKCFLPPS